MVGNSPILNIEPVAALLLAWALLGQRIGALQWLGALLVVGAVMGLGLRRRRDPAGAQGQTAARRGERTSP